MKDVLGWFAIGGVVAIAATSPYLVSNALRVFAKRKKYNKRSVQNVFYRLRKEGSIRIDRQGRQIYISLTETGKRRAGRFQVDSLRIKKPKRWDKKWRIVIFDVADAQRVKREALRGFLKRLGFYKLQESVWIFPYDCADEVGLLRDFFGFTQEELRFMIAENIGEDEEIKRQFHLT